MSQAGQAEQILRMPNACQTTRMRGAPAFFFADMTCRFVPAWHRPATFSTQVLQGAVVQLLEDGAAATCGPGRDVHRERAVLFAADQIHHAIGFVVSIGPADVVP